MIKRSSKHAVEQILEKNNWSVLDIGCGYAPSKYANVICDTQNLENHYKDKKFVQLKDKRLPFEDKKFDFVIASHVLEHVEDPEFFLNEIQRVSSFGGYIEVPTKLEDNLVFENKNDHVWHMDFDDVDNELIISKRTQIIEPILTVSSIKKLNENFRKSLVIELFWDDKIDYKIESYSVTKNNKVSVLNLLRKYISKRIRIFFN